MKNQTSFLPLTVPVSHGSSIAAEGHQLHPEKGPVSKKTLHCCGALTEMQLSPAQGAGFSLSLQYTFIKATETLFVALLPLPPHYRVSSVAHGDIFALSGTSSSCRDCALMPTVPGSREAAGFVARHGMVRLCQGA